MANLNKAPVDKSQSYAGTFGNDAVAIFKYTAAAAAIGDIIYFGKIPKGAYVHSFKMVNAALGASTTLKVGYTTAEIGGTLTADDDYFLTATATSSAATTNAIASAVPIKFTEEVYLIGTLAGGAATGDVYLVVQYEYKGN